MRRSTRARPFATGVVTAALAATALAGAPAEGCYEALPDDPETTDVDESVDACEVQLWIADPSGTKAGNLATTGNSEFPTLSPDEPTASVASPDGASSGAGYLGTSLLQLAEDDPDRTGFTIKGQFTGLIDSIGLTLHGVHSGFGRLPFGPTDPLPPEDPNPTAPVERGPMTAYVSIEVDGRSVIPIQQLEIEFTTGPAPNANASEEYRATITGLAERLQARRLDLGEDAVHDVTIRITPRYVNTDPVVLFLYGTSEVPSGIVFNAVEPDPDVVTVEA